MSKVLYITLGCAKNEVDTDRMRALLIAAGYGEASSPDEADVAVINTCSFLSSATSESIECTLTLAEEAVEGARSLPIVMCGCVPSRYGDSLPEELPEVAAFVRHDEEDGIVEVVRRVLGDKSELGEAPSVLRTSESASAFVKISEGCDRYCTFCAIPYIRGRYVSRGADEILAEVDMLMAGGVKEVILIGQDTGVWGHDLDGKPTLADLLREVASHVRPYGGWVRVLYLQPEGMTDELVSVIRDVPEVLPYIDIPVQHCSTPILHAMARRGSAKEYLDLFERLRREIPGMVLRSTAMVGFPGETEDQFNELMDFVEAAELDYCSVFAYSAEEGTRAAELPNQVDEDVKVQRNQLMLDVCEQMGFSATAAHLGETVDVIIDGIEEGEHGSELIGHTWFQAPDSDGVVHIEEGEAAVGDIVRCKLVDAFCYELVGEIVEGEDR